jgi:hypothetical protein
MTQEAPVNPPETVEKAKLEALIEDWREQQESYPPTEQGEAAAAAVRLCADELEETINE